MLTETIDLYKYFGVARGAAKSGKLRAMRHGQMPELGVVKERPAMLVIPGGAYRNQEHVSGLLDAGDVDEVYVDLLSDPQTSGGLLFAVPEEEAEDMLRAFERADLGTKVSVVGRVTDSGVDRPGICLRDKAEMR